MPFWAQGSAVAGSNRPSAPARPLSYVLGTGSASLTEYSTLVRLRVDVPSAAAALAAAAEDVDDDLTAAELAEDAACALGQLHQVIRGIEHSSDEARAAAVLELMQDKSLQVLCSKVRLCLSQSMRKLLRCFSSAELKHRICVRSQTTYGRIMIAACTTSSLQSGRGTPCWALV